MRKAFDAFGKLLAGDESPETPPENAAHRPSPHPLVAAAEAYVACARDYDAYCERKGIYEAARNANIKFTKQTQFAVFKQLETIVGRASHDMESFGRLRQETTEALVNSATKLKNIFTDPRCVVFTAAQENYITLGNCFKGPKVSYALSAFINQAQEQAQRQRPEQFAWEKDIDSLKHAAEALGALFPDAKKPSSSAKPGRYEP
ncbi:MAG: hypothetical protein WCD70_10795 [Alphaproteobacteria bacterium]